MLDGTHQTEYLNNGMLSLVVLCYRSEEKIIPIVRHLHAMLSLLKCPWEIVLVANYIKDSNDRTPGIVQQLEQELPGIRSIVKPKDGMMGWDMRSGLEACKGDYLAIIDGDGQYPLESVIACYLKILDGNWDMVKTYRVRRDDGIVRRVVSFFYNHIFHVLFPSAACIDVNSKPKILSRQLYEALHLTDDGWFIDAEMMLKAKWLNARVGELPILFYRLERRQSFVRASALLEFWRKLIDFKRREKEIRTGLNKTDFACRPPKTAAITARRVD